MYERSSSTSLLAQVLPHIQLLTREQCRKKGSFYRGGVVRGGSWWVLLRRRGYLQVVLVVKVTVFVGPADTNKCELVSLSVVE